MDYETKDVLRIQLRTTAALGSIPTGRARIFFNRGSEFTTVIRGH